jgi:predicted transcriptional regulator
MHIVKAGTDHPRRAGRSVTQPESGSAESGSGKPPVPPALHELEAEVMEVVWNRGESSVREVMEVLNASAPRERAYTTYMTIMARLDAKGMLQRRRQGKTDLYTSAYVRDQYSDMRARAELESVVNQ